MKGLLIKDIYILREYCKSIIFIMLIYLFVIIFADSKAGIGVDGFVAAYIPALAITTLSVDERNGWLNAVDSLPVKRSDVVLSKYIITIMISVICALIFALVRGIKAGFPAAAELFFMNAGIGMLANAIELPAIFKLGVDKSRYINVFVIMIVVSGLVSLNGIGLEFTYSIPLAIAAVVMTVLSIILSVKLFDAREL